MIAEVQKNGGIAGFIDAEHALDPVYAKNIGVDIDNLYISQPDNGEQALEIAETMVRSGAIDIVVVDSVAALVPKAEIDVYKRQEQHMQILFVSLGCDKNLVDTEMMLGQLAEKGYTFTDDEAEADIAVVNSCCFIGDAKEESINTILQLAEWKTEGRLKALIVCGCLAQRYKDEIQTEIPEVDAIIGTTAIETIVETGEAVLAGKSENHLEDIDRACVYGVPRSVTTGGHFAYLKIAEGCNKRCTYCVIPSVRGNYRSIPMDSLVREAKKLVENGAKRCV